MSEALYATDAYLREFEARVAALAPDGRAVALDRSAFYPGGGGQPCDQGWLDAGGAALAVARVAREGGQVWHHLAAPASLAVGQELRGRLDWERRYALMRIHTALHVLCGVVWRDHAALVTGGNMEPGRGRLDFELARLDAELVASIAERCAREVAAARPVRVRVVPREEAFRIPDLVRTKVNLLPEGIREVRTVEIVGLDLQADGGTHVANTREVGTLAIVDHRSKGALNKRLYVEVR